MKEYYAIEIIIFADSNELETIYVFTVVVKDSGLPVHKNDRVTETFRVLEEKAS